jgi:hypothetical protein
MGVETWNCKYIQGSRPVSWMGYSWAYMFFRQIQARNYHLWVNQLDLQPPISLHVAWGREVVATWYHLGARATLKSRVPMSVFSGLQSFFLFQSISHSLIIPWGWILPVLSDSVNPGIPLKTEQVAANRECAGVRNLPRLPKGQLLL